MNKLFIVVILLVCLLALSDAARKKKSSSSSSSQSSKPTTSSGSTSSSSSLTPEKKFGMLLERLKDGPVIPLADSNFTKFTTDRPREYYSILMFTATNPRYMCSICGRVKGQYDEIAAAYHSQFNFSTVPIEKRIVFFRLEVDDARTVFNDLALETVPRFYILPPTKVDSPKSKISDLEVDARPFLEGVSTAFELLKEKTNGEVNIRVLTDPMIVLLAIGFTTIIAALFVAYASYDFEKALLSYQSPQFWVFVSMICFGVGVSGSIFCVIRSTPLFGYTRQGALSIFAAQGRDQYTAEGIIVALWTLGCGLSYYGLYFFSKVRFPVLRHVGILLSLTCFFVFAVEIWKAYTVKTSWYSLRETFPADVWKFFASSVKKNSGFGKRLLRLSEIWLYDFKDWDTMYKKFDGLIVEYAKRAMEKN